MTTIVVTHEDNDVDEFEFGPDCTLIGIGRRSSNDVCIPNLSVSGTHARITFSDGQAFIEDLNSTNGTYINGRLISRQPLVDGDEIIVGKTRVTVRLTQAAQHTAEPPAELPAIQAPAEQPVASAAIAGSASAAAEVSDALQDELQDDELSPPSHRMQAAGATTPPLDTDPAQPDPFDASIEAAVDALDEEIADASLDDGVVEAARRESMVFDDDEDDLLLDDSQLADYDDEPADEQPMSLSEKAKLALGRSQAPRPRLQAVPPVSAGDPLDDLDDAGEDRVPAAIDDDFDDSGDIASLVRSTPSVPTARTSDDHARTEQPLIHDLDSASRSVTAVIEIKNGAKSGQVLPIDKPVTTLGRPGIQIAAIMRKPDGYFLMHIESDDSVERPTLNHDAIGDEPVLLHSGDELNVAGIDVEFMLS